MIQKKTILDDSIQLSTIEIEMNDEIEYKINTPKTIKINKSKISSLIEERPTVI
jgi:sRNA-binding carbon storage regulator CsrA